MYFFYVLWESEMGLALYQVERDVLPKLLNDFRNYSFLSFGSKNVDPNQEGAI